MQRRHFLASASAALLSGCTHKPMQTNTLAAPTLPFYDVVPPLVPIRAHEDRLYKITVCLRPFRAIGPRIEAERIADQLIIHNYGHGGSGWSLSWGSGALALNLITQGTGQSLAGRQIAVLGCGALGLTTATLLQKAGAQVTIYAKERTADARSFRATGSWTPDSRVALTKSATPAFAAQWEQMTRTSWHTYQSYLGLPGNPIEFTDRYVLSDPPPEQAQQQRYDEDPIGFAHFNDRVRDLTPRYLDLPPGTHPFPTRYCRTSSQLMFNITDLAHQLTEDILIGGGKIETREFHTPSELAQLSQKVIVNCTGYGARALFSDTSITPVRGQIGWLIPQPNCLYGIVHDNLNVLARRDGIVIQLSEQGEASGWDNTNEQPDRREAEEGVRQLRALYDRMEPGSLRQARI